MFHAKGEQNIFFIASFFPNYSCLLYAETFLHKEKKHCKQRFFTYSVKLDYSSWSSLIQFSHTFLPLICLTVLALPQKMQHGSYFLSRI